MNKKYLPLYTISIEERVAQIIREETCRTTLIEIDVIASQVHVRVLDVHSSPVESCNAYLPSPPGEIILPFCPRQPITNKK